MSQRLLGSLSSRGVSTTHAMSFLPTFASSFRLLCSQSPSHSSLAGTRSLGAEHSSRQSSSRREMPSVSRLIGPPQDATGHEEAKAPSQKPVRVVVRSAANGKSQQSAVPEARRWRRKLRRGKR